MLNSIGVVGFRPLEPPEPPEQAGSVGLPLYTEDWVGSLATFDMDHYVILLHGAWWPSRFVVHFFFLHFRGMGR